MVGADPGTGIEYWLPWWPDGEMGSHRGCWGATQVRCLGCKQSLGLARNFFLNCGVRRADLKNLLGPSLGWGKPALLHPSWVTETSGTLTWRAGAGGSDAGPGISLDGISGGEGLP